MRRAEKPSFKVEVETQPIFHEVEFIKLPKSRSVYCGVFRQRTYLCKRCMSVVVSKTEHLAYHQAELRKMIDVAYRVISLDELEHIQYKAVEVDHI